MRSVCKPQSREGKRCWRRKRDFNLFEQRLSLISGLTQTGRQGSLAEWREGKAEGGKVERHIDRRDTEKRDTVHTKGCLGGIWWTDVCVCELMEKSSSLRGPKLAFAHQDENSL